MLFFLLEIPIHAKMAVCEVDREYFHVDPNLPCSHVRGDTRKDKSRHRFFFVCTTQNIRQPK